MFSFKEFCQGPACFVIGGIITVMFLKILEWQRNQLRNQNPLEERGEGRIMVPVQEVGDRERQEARIVHEYTVQITKFPREQDEF